ncbi:hypothetical protein M2651_01770 [Clostridium sp. SYSU_GA19001]|uniref:hypothetical protein n=1 Tax=Clostridium caldaquaticum TaxID=2940653 RepID=UPI002076D8A9|nr:hypothetical protein [Clostridium caldaquaticum]MCM8709749.1 hypothetical protein [Clostridium caldaquaticum]
MKYERGKKMVKLLHIIRVCFKRFFITIGVIIFGAALLQIYSLINFINKMAVFYKSNPSGIIVILLVIIAIPTLSYGLEKSLDIYLEHKG